MKITFRFWFPNKKSADKLAEKLMSYNPNCIRNPKGTLMSSWPSKYKEYGARVLFCLEEQQILDYGKIVQTAMQTACKGELLRGDDWKVISYTTKRYINDDAQKAIDAINKVNDNDSFIYEDMSRTDYLAYKKALCLSIEIIKETC